MLNLLKKLFSVKEGERAEREELKVGELEGWFENKSDKIFSELDSDISKIKCRLKDVIAQTKDNLAVLTTAKLHNPDVSVRENQFMEGNRGSYIMGVNNFLRGIELEKDDYPSLLEFCNHFGLNLEKFSRSTVRAYNILQEFFSHESRNIAINIREIESLVKELKEAIESAGIAKVEEIRKGITDLNNKIGQRNALLAGLKEKEKARESLIKGKETIENEIKWLVKSREYKKLNSLKADREVCLTALREHNAKAIHSFSVVEKPLRKLQRIILEDKEDKENSGLIQNYIENPVNALADDNELKVVGLLQKLEKNINSYTLDLKDKKREKVLETLKGLSEEFLRGFISRHNELDERLRGLEKELRENEAFGKEKKLDYELREMQEHLERLNSEILGEEGEMDRLDIERMKNDLSSKISSLLKEEVSLRVG